MPTIQECISIVQKASGLSNAEASDVVNQLAKEKERVRASGDIANLERKLGEYAISQTDQQKIDASLKKKHAALNVLRRQEVDDYLGRFEQETGDVYEGIMGLLGGSHKRVKDARRSVDAHRMAIGSEWLGGMMQEINARPHVLKMLRKDDSFLEDVVREMYEVRPGGKRGVTGSEDAAFAAEVLSKYSEAARLRLNRAGAFIKKLEGWTPQGHDEWKILKRAPQAKEWVDFVYPLLDHEKTFSGMSENEVRDILAEVHENIITGQNRRVSARERGEFLGPRNFARSMGHERILHFKDADNWLKYHKEFGHKNVLTSIVNHLDMSSRRLALMERLGPNPENMLNSIIDNRIRSIRNNPDIKSQTKRKMIDRLKAVDLGAAQGGIGRLYSDVSGNNLIPAGDITYAKLWSGIRSVQAMAKLGGATLSAMADTLTFAMNARFNGVNVFESYGKAFYSLLEGRSKGEKREIAYALGTLYDGVLGDINSRWNAQDSVPGAMSRATNKFFQWSGLQYWTESLKAGYAKMLSSHLATMKGRGWAELPKQIQDVLSYHGFDEGSWDVIKRAIRKAEDGREYILPELIDNQKLRTDLRAFFIDETKYAVIEPDARTRSVLTLGQRPGTIQGELARFVMQFKSFPIAYYQRNLRGRRFQAPGKGADLPGIAHWIAGSLVFGYAAMSAKDIAKGRKPRDPRKLNTWTAAALQSGGAGIYGDFLLAKYNRFSGGPLETAIGPTIGTASNLLEMGSKALHGDFDPGDLVYTAINNTPYINLWYTRMALDYAVLFHVREMLSPGTLRRTERRIKEDYNQEYMSPLRPSRVIKRGGWGYK